MRTLHLFHSRTQKKHVSNDSPHENKTGPYTAQIDQSERMVSAIVSGVTACTGRGVTDLPPLYNVVDSEALEQVFAPPLGPQHRSNNERIVFTYAGCEIVIDRGDELTVRLLKDQQERE